MKGFQQRREYFELSDNLDKQNDFLDISQKRRGQ